MTRESHAPPLAAGRESKCRFSRVAAARQRFFQTARAILARILSDERKKAPKAGPYRHYCKLNRSRHVPEGCDPLVVAPKGLSVSTIVQNSGRASFCTGLRPLCEKAPPFRLVGDLISSFEPRGRPSLPRGSREVAESLR